MLRARYELILIVVGALGSAGLAAERAGSQIFRAEGHGRRVYYYFPDDEIRRITALDDVVTPHITWIKPIRGGPVRVLAIAHKSQGRWPVELAQRFDVKVTTVYGHSPSQLGSPAEYGMFVQKPADVQARVLQAMNEPLDVVISDIPPKVLGLAICKRLNELLNRGVGYVGSVDELDLGKRAQAAGTERDMVRSTVPIGGLRALAKPFGTVEAAAGKILKLWTDSGAGRVADLTGYPRDADRPGADRLQYLWLPSMEQEVWSALAGRAVLWAARRLPAGNALKVDWPDGPIDRGAMPFPLKVAGATGSSLRVRV